MPVSFRNYIVTVPNSIEGWTIRNVGYGPNTGGVLDARPQEILYMDLT